MNVVKVLITVISMLIASIWKEHSNVYVKLVLQGMEKHAEVLVVIFIYILCSKAIVISILMEGRLSRFSKCYKCQNISFTRYESRFEFKIIARTELKHALLIKHWHRLTTADYLGKKFTNGDFVHARL